MILERQLRDAHPFADGELMVALDGGLAWQADLCSTVHYGEDYFAKTQANDASPIAEALNAARRALVDRYVGQNRVCDIGIGGGGFILHRPNTWGFDINSRAVQWLAEHGKLAMQLDEFAGWCMWDVFEHLPQPRAYLNHMELGGYLFVSIPVFEDLTKIRESKHYRPGEHLRYFTRDGFIRYMAAEGFRVLEVNDDETRAGRESIQSFAFSRVMWPVEGRRPFREVAWPANA
jgi:hypothetical protein